VLSLAGQHAASAADETRLHLTWQTNNKVDGIVQCGPENYTPEVFLKIPDG